jgi:conflict system pore-forming effector with SLATT domain
MAEDFWATVSLVTSCFNGGISVTRENGREYVLATARELYGRAVYSHKTHEIEREIWGKKACRMMYVNIFLTSLTALLAIISAALQPPRLLVITAVMAFLTTGFVLWQSSFDPIGKENQHRTAAKELLWIREQLLLLIERCHIETEPLPHLQVFLECITREVTGLYKFAPATSAGAYMKAGAALKNGEFTFSDAEIDAFLPTKLRTIQSEK